MKARIIFGSLFLLPVLGSRADRGSDVPVLQRDVRTLSDGPGMAASIATILGLLQASGMPDRPTHSDGGSSLSLSNQVGLQGVSRMITQMTNNARQAALEETRRVYCGRMAACERGRQMALNMGHHEAEKTVDKDMEYLDSVMMGIRGLDCRNMYRGCTDFQ